MTALTRRSAASAKGWESRRRMAAARARMDGFMADGTPIESPPPRGTARGDFSPRELIERIRLSEKGGAAPHNPQRGPGSAAAADRAEGAPDSRERDAAGDRSAQPARDT